MSELWADIETAIQAAEFEQTILEVAKMLVDEIEALRGDRRSLKSDLFRTERRLNVLLENEAYVQQTEFGACVFTFNGVQLSPLMETCEAAIDNTIVASQLAESKDRRKDIMGYACEGEVFIPKEDWYDFVLDFLPRTDAVVEFGPPDFTDEFDVRVPYAANTECSPSEQAIPPKWKKKMSYAQLDTANAHLVDAFDDLRRENEELKSDIADLRKKLRSQGVS